MTTADQFPNRNAVDEALTVYLPAMRDFIVYQLKQIRGSKVPELMLSAAYGDRLARFQRGFNDGQKPEDIIDVSDCLPIIVKHWNERFRDACDRNNTFRNRLAIVTEGRNATAHFKQDDMSLGDAIEYLNAMATVLGVARKHHAQERVAELRDSLLPSRNSEKDGELSDRQDSLGKSATSSTHGGLKPWSAVIDPHPDILNGQMTSSTFAADLQQVADGNAPNAEYRYPVQFFTRSFLTPGLKALLVNTVKRLTGGGGDPVIQMKTGFGGGKTHSLIALWHLVKSCEELCYQAIQPTDATGESLRSVFEDAGFDPNAPFNAQAAVLIGTSRSATEEAVTADSGDPLNTLWGQMAYQLGGQSAYNIIGTASREWTAPGGSELDVLFRQVGPCVILIDELVAYTRNLNAEQAGRLYTFIHNLTEAVKRSQHVELVVTVPQSAAELGGASGVAVAESINAILGRIESINAPLETHEAFEVVRRRLFKDVVDRTSLEETCAAFFSMYVNSKKEYPTDAQHAAYEDKMRRCYPIHPEVFERLHVDWSTIHEFQRTRGVLRMLAIAIRRLHHPKCDPLIMPANLPLTDSRLTQEFTKVLNGNWDPVIEEIDGFNSKADGVDHEVPRFLRMGDGAAKRVTRTIFLGSVPGKALIGLDEQQILLGCAEPQHNIADYHDARNRLNGRLYFLHEQQGRYFLRTEPNLNKLHHDIVADIQNHAVDEHIHSILNEAVGRRARDIDIVVFPRSSEDIPDKDEVQLVVLNPDQSLNNREGDRDTARPVALNLLLMHGERDRLRRNMLVFLAGRKDEIRELRRLVRAHLAWVAIVDRIPELGLSPRNQSQARRHEVDSRRDVSNATVTAYREALVPKQRDPLATEYQLRRIRVPNLRPGRIGQNTIEKLLEDEELNEGYSNLAFQRLLSDHFWSEGVNHLDLDQLWDRLTELVFLPRFTRRATLNAVVVSSQEQGIIATADSYDGSKYEGLDADESVSERSRLLVRREVADTQRQQTHHPPTAEPEPVDPNEAEPGSTGPPDEVASDSDRKTRKVVGIRAMKGIDAVSVDYNRVRDEIAKHLSDDGGSVTVTIMVEAEHDYGFSRAVEAGVRHNGDTLGVQLQFDPS